LKVMMMNFLFYSHESMQRNTIISYGFLKLYTLNYIDTIIYILLFNFTRKLLL